MTAKNALLKDYLKKDIYSIDCYKLGMYMWYFIGLAYLFRSNRKKFDEMKVYFGKDDFLFFAEGPRRQCRL